jgi:hypothetical protein
MPVIEYMYENGCPWDDEAMNGAVECGDVSMLQYMHAHGCGFSEWIYHIAARRGNLDIFKFLCKNTDPPAASIADIAAQYGHLPIIKYMHKHVVPWSNVTTSIVANHGHADVLKYLHKSGCPCDDVCHNAIIGDNLDILKWAVGAGIACGTDCTYLAAKFGHLRILKYLHKKVRPWDITTYRYAIKYGQTIIASYLATHGCPR